MKLTQQKKKALEKLIETCDSEEVRQELLCRSLGNKGAPFWEDLDDFDLRFLYIALTHGKTRRELS